jgi:hypothetical protein
MRIRLIALLLLCLFSALLSLSKSSAVNLTLRVNESATRVLLRESKTEDALAVEVTSSKVSLAELGFTAADTFGAMLVAYRQEGALPETSSLRQMVQQLASGVQAQVATAGKKSRVSKKPSADSQQVVWTEYEKLTAEAALAEGKKIFHIVAQIDPLCAMPIAARQLVANALGAVAQVLGTRPEPGSAANVQKLDVLVATAQAENDIVAKCRISVLRCRGGHACSSAPRGGLDRHHALPERRIRPLRAMWIKRQ